MELQVAMPSPAAEFNFESACSSPYMTAPSSPKHFAATATGNYVSASAPASPTRISAALYGVPFLWEETPGVPKGAKPQPPLITTTLNNNGGDNTVHFNSDDFEFQFSGQLERESFSVSAADELFDGGKIRPLKPPPGLISGTESPAAASPRSPRISLSPRRRPSKGFEVDPFAAAIEETRRKEEVRVRVKVEERSDSANFAGRSEIRSRSRSRSLSPMRVSDAVFGHDDGEIISSSRFSGKITPPSPSPATALNSAYSSLRSAILFAKDYRRWKLKDFLFRSASEGRSPRNDDVLGAKYSVLSPPAAKKSSTSKISSASDDVRNSSFRSTDSVGSVSSRRRGPVEIHYTVNRAASEEMRKKTFLPYKQGLLGCLGFNHGMHEISRTVGSLSRA